MVTAVSVPVSAGGNCGILMTLMAAAMTPAALYRGRLSAILYMCS